MNQILNIYTNKVICESDNLSIKELAQNNSSNLRDANLYNANLEDVNLIDANLRNANLGNADLRNANLEDADLEDADLRNANLRDANLKNANLPIYCKWRVSYNVVSNSEKVTINDIDINLIKIEIGYKCKSKTIKEWDSWFKSQEEYSTKRDTFEFKQIYGMYKAYRAYLTTVYGEINE